MTAVPVARKWPAIAPAHTLSGLSGQDWGFLGVGLGLGLGLGLEEWTRSTAIDACLSKRHSAVAIKPGLVLVKFLQVELMRGTPTRTRDR